MTRDFAKKPRPAASKRPATRKNNRKTQPRSSAPAWVWLLTGAALGAFIVFLAYLSGVAPQPAPDSPVMQALEKSNPQYSTPKPRFDFYTLLKESEVTVKPPSSPPRNSASVTDEEYILQVGSFKKVSDADRLRAELILLNLSAQVETVTVRNGETWYRVLVGPYDNSSRVAKARSILASNDINPLLLKRKRQ